jgi:HlyD family secretion protein
MRALLVVLIAGCGASAAEPGARVVEVKRQDLVIDAEVTGTLRALDSDTIGPPPIPRFWDFKIVRMAPEGVSIKAGKEVLAFDATELQKRLRDYESEVASLSEELGKARAEAALADLNDRLEREQKEADARKAELKADKPPDLTAELKLKQALLDRELTRREVEFGKQKYRNNRLRERSDLAALGNRLARAQSYAEIMRRAVAQMSVRARRDGTVVYKQNFRGEKRKVGDQVSPGDAALEVAALERMGADGQVDEVDASKLRVGQRVGVRLEATPDVEHPGVVERIAPLVHTESPESRVKVAELSIKLEKTDPMMRPGMRFRGRIEVQRVPDVLQVPVAAIKNTARGAEVMAVSAGGTEPVPVKLGRRSRDAVEVVTGLRQGDRVAIERSGSGARPTTGGAAGAVGGSKP